MASRDNASPAPDELGISSSASADDDSEDGGWAIEADDDEDDIWNTSDSPAAPAEGDDDDDGEIVERTEDVLKKPIGKIFSAIALQGISSHARKRPVSALDDAWIVTTYRRISGLSKANPDSPDGDRWDRDQQLLEAAAAARKIDLDAVVVDDAGADEKGKSNASTGKADHSHHETGGPTAPASALLQIVPLPLQAISPDPAQARDEGADDELAASIAEVGVLQPIRVYEDELHPGFYIIEDGERRYRGSVKAGQAMIPAIVVPAPENEGDKLLLQVVSNDGKRLKPMEEARTFKRIMASKGWSIQQLAEHLGKSKSTVSDRIALADIPAPFVDAFEKGELTAAAAPILRQLLTLPAKTVVEIADQVRGDWYYERAAEDGKPVPLKTLEKAVKDALGEVMFVLDDDVAAEYSGEIQTIGKVRYAVDVKQAEKLYAKIANQKAEAQAAGVKVSAPKKREPSKWELDERKRQAAARKRGVLRRAQLAALSEKLPTVLDGGWSLFLVRHLIDEMHNDSRREATKLLGLDATKRSAYGGFAFDKTLLKHAESLKPGERVRMALQLLLAGDLCVSPHSTGGAQRLASAATLAKFDLTKVKIPEKTEFPAGAKMVQPAKSKKKAR